MKKKNKVDLKHTQMRVLPEEVRQQLLPEAFIYPNLDNQNELIEMLAEHHNLPPDQLCLGSGTGELIDGIISAFGQKIMTFIPTFYLFDFYSKKYNSQVEFIKWPWEKGRLKIDEKKFVEQTLVWICNPNNPTGHWIEPEYIFELASKTKGIIAIDENFSVFRDPEAIPLAALENAPDNIISILSFSKIFGIPGQRLGYAIGEKSRIAKLNSQFETYHINALAVKYGRITLSHWDKYKVLIKGVIDRRNRLGQKLIEFGYDLLPQNGSWLTIKFKTLKENERIKTLLENEGVLALPIYDFEFSYAEKDPCLRLAVPTEEDFNFVIDAFDKLKDEL